VNQTSSSKNWTRQHEVATFLHDREFSYVTQHNAKETLINIYSLSETTHNNTASILTFLRPVVAAVISSLQSLSADNLMPTSVIRSHSVNFKIPVALPKCCDSGSSASLKAIRNRKFTVCYNIGPRSWELGHCTESSASESKKLRSSYDKNCLAENDIQFRRVKEKENIRIFCIIICGKIL